MMSDLIPCKLYIVVFGSNKTEEIRRFRFDPRGQTLTNFYDQYVAPRIKGSLLADEITLEYLDDENDWVLVSMQEEFDDALNLFRCKDGAFKVKIQIKPIQQQQQQQPVNLPVEEEEEEELESEHHPEEAQQQPQEEQEELQQQQPQPAPAVEAKKHEEQEEVKKVEPMIHYSVCCDNCLVAPVKGLRFKCRNCHNYDLCEACYPSRSTFHNCKHVFVEIPTPLANDDQIRGIYKIDGQWYNVVGNARIPCDSTTNVWTIDRIDL